MKPVTVIFKGYEITTDKGRMQPAAVHRWLSQESYWCRHIPFDTVRASMEHSFCLGILKDDAQVGFARLVTDYATFGYLADVYVESAHREQGLAKRMIQLLMEQEWVLKLRRLMLATHDAHSLYAGFGFVNPPIPERLMELCRPVLQQEQQSV